MEYQEENEQELDIFVLIGDFLKIGRRYIVLLVLLVTVCSAGLTGYRRLRYYPMYEAYASFTVRVANPLYASVSGYNSKTAEVMAATFPSIITSGVMKKHVREDLGVTFLPSISVSALGSSSIITIRVVDGNPEYAYRVLNSVMTHYPDVSKFVLSPTEMELLDESCLPTHPYNPFNTVGYLVKGGIVGAALWCVIIACMALLKNTIHNEDELTRTLNLDCMGHVPEVKISSRQSCPYDSDVHMSKVYRYKQNKGLCSSDFFLYQISEARHNSDSKYLKMTSYHAKILYISLSSDRAR